jgi:hypothetical protein
MKETKIFQEIITLQQISSFNTSQKYHLSGYPHRKIDLLPKYNFQKQKKNPLKETYSTADFECFFFQIT